MLAGDHFELLAATVTYCRCFARPVRSDDLPRSSFLDQDRRPSVAEPGVTDERETLERRVARLEDANAQMLELLLGFVRDVMRIRLDLLPSERADSYVASTSSR